MDGNISKHRLGSSVTSDSLLYQRPIVVARLVTLHSKALYGKLLNLSEHFYAGRCQGQVKVRNGVFFWGGGAGQTKEGNGSQA